MASASVILYRRSARNVRKINRSLQTASEKLERWLDRATQAKRLDPSKVQASAVPLFDTMKNFMREEERALSDLIGAASQ